MELLLTDEQRLLQDSVAGFLERHGGVKRARSLRGKGFDRAVHREMAAEGWFAILVPPERGGLGLGLTDLALVLEQAGRALAPEPVAITALAAARVADIAGRAWARELLEGVLSGERIVALGFGGKPVDGEPARLSARVEHGAAKIDGRIEDLAPADGFDDILLAVEATTGPVTCHLPAGAAGITATPRPNVDGRPLGTLALAAARSEHVGDGHGGLYEMALVAASAELLGVMDAALAMTVEYLKTRKQFGKPIGSFQALQHRAVDDYTRIASTRSLLFQICAQGGVPSPAMASALKAHASGEALALTKSAIQMHGAIGFTDEYDIGLYLKRAMWLSTWLGNEAAHRKRYAALME